MYKVIIIGSGSIGALKEARYDDINSKSILTHANAVYRHSKYKLIGIIDQDIGWDQFALLIVILTDRIYILDTIYLM